MLDCPAVFLKEVRKNRCPIDSDIQPSYYICLWSGFRSLNREDQNVLYDCFRCFAIKRRLLKYHRMQLMNIR